MMHSHLAFLALFSFFALLLHRFRVASLDKMSHYFLGNLEVSIEFNDGLRGQDHVDKHIVAISVVFNWVCQAAAPPLIYFDDLTVIIVDDLLDALQNSACLLFADFGVENEA